MTLSRESHAILAVFFSCAWFLLLRAFAVGSRGGRGGGGGGGVGRCAFQYRCLLCLLMMMTMTMMLVPS